MMKFSTGSFVVGIMLGILITGAWFMSDELPRFSFSSASRISTSTEGGFNGSSAGGTLAVFDQPSGDTVIVESVTVPPPGVWVAVRETNGGSLGNVLGATRITGPRSGVLISLLRATETGNAYAVELYRDDNNGEFSPSANSVYVDFDSGTPVIVRFMATN